MPQHGYSSQKGNLYVKFNIKLPSKLNEEEKALIREIFE